jgi:type I restriction enzyme S subunit
MSAATNRLGANGPLRDTGIPWLGQIPPHWKVIPLRFLVQFLSGATPDTSKTEFWNGDIPWVTPKDMKRDVIEDAEDHVTAAALSSSALQLVEPAAVLVVVRGMILAHSFPTAVTTRQVTINQDMKALRCGEMLEPRFLKNYFRGLEGHLVSMADSSAHGTRKLETEILGRFEVCVPPLADQRTIADHLDREMARLDGLVAAKERVLGLLADKRRALITRAVTRGLDPDTPLRDSGIPWLGEIPAHWETQRVAWLFQERDERGEPDLPLLEVSINAGVVLREFSEDRIESTAADFKTYKVARKGDIVFNKMRMWQGAVGVAPEDGLVSPDYTVATPYGALSSTYAGQLFRTEGFSAECARRSHGIVWDRMRLYWEGFRDIEVPLPAQEEQRTILAYVETEAAKLDALRAATERTIVLIKERRAALIAAAVTGQLPIAAEPAPQDTTAAVV